MSTSNPLITSLPAPAAPAAPAPTEPAAAPEAPPGSLEAAAAAFDAQRAPDAPLAPAAPSAPPPAPPSAEPSAAEPPDPVTLARAALEKVLPEQLEAVTRQAQEAAQRKALEERAALAQRLSGDEWLEALLETRGMSAAELTEHLNKRTLAGDAPAHDPVKAELAELRAQLEAQTKAAEETKKQEAETAQQQELLSGIRSLISTETYPFLAAGGPEDAATLVTAKIWEHYQSTGEVLPAQRVLEEHNTALQNSLTLLLRDDSLLGRLGLQRQPTTPQQPTAAPPAAPGVITNSVASTAATPAPASADLPSGDDLIRAAAAQFDAHRAS